MTDKAWLDRLNVGDEVAVQQHRFGPGWEYRIVKIDRITPTRQFVAGGRRFRKDGREPSRGGYYRSASMVPVTEEIRESLAKDRMLMRIKGVDFNAFDATQLRIICDAIDAIDEARRKP